MNDNIDAGARQESLKRSFEHVAEAAEGLLRTTVDETREEWHRAREALGKKARAVRAKVSSRTRDIACDARELGTKGQRLINRHPWISASIGVGVVLGSLAILFARSRRNPGP